MLGAVNVLAAVLVGNEVPAVVTDVADVAEAAVDADDAELAAVSVAAELADVAEAAAVLGGAVPAAPQLDNTRSIHRVAIRGSKKRTRSDPFTVQRDAIARGGAVVRRRDWTEISGGSKHHGAPFHSKAQYHRKERHSD